jgi:predicted DNA repair protein MutK
MQFLKQSKWHQVFALLDDIAAIMDDVAYMSKLQPKNGGILGDDLAVNAEKASGFISENFRFMGHCKGSLINKVIILPIAFVERLFA